MKQISRRELLTSAAAGAAVLAGAAPAHARSRFTADKVNVGMIGTANQAGWNMGQLDALPNVNIAALCDVDDTLLASAAAGQLALGSLARPGPGEAIQPCLCALQLAVVVGLRRRHPRRYGLPPRRPAQMGAKTGESYLC